MQVKRVVFNYRGREVSGDVVFPDSIAEAVAALGEDEVFSSFLLGYLERQKKRLRRKRQKRYLRIDLQSLDDAAILKLREIGLMG